MLFSVVICSYNRREHVVGAVTSVLQQTLPSDAYEVVVVDNRSTDGTAEAVAEIAASNSHVRYVYEGQPGLAVARNAGWRAAKGTYIAFLDDDARASANWLETAKRLIEENPSGLCCVGGPIHPFYTSPQPDWWRDAYEIRTRGDVPRHLRQGEAFSGSNMIWLAETLRTYGGFDVSAGMKGTTLGMGEETALFRRVWEGEEAPVFLYSPDLRVYHWVPPEKMTMRYIAKRAAANGQFEARFALSQNPGLAGRLRLLAGTARTVATEVPTVLLKRRKYRRTQNWYFEHCFIPIQHVSTLLRLLGVRISVSQRSGDDA